MSSELATRKRFILVCAGVVLSSNEFSKRKRKWMKEWLLDRSLYSDIHLVKKLKATEPDDYKNYLRMTDVEFEYLLNIVKPLITKQDTKMRESISAEQRLIITLRYLATGSDYIDLKYSSRVSAQAIGKIVPETCLAIYNSLKKDYLKFPSNESDWKSIAEGFKSQWNFEHCLGAIDGKHVLIQKPPQSGSYFFNYKGTFSVVLLAIVDANYKFIYIHEGTNGRISDGGILRRTDFYQKLENLDLGLPSPEKLDKSSYICPYGFVGDEAFPLQENIWKPYPQAGINKEERIFNYRLSRGRRVAENAFGILNSRFKVFQKPMKIKVEHVDAVILASCALHNFLRTRSSNYIGPRSVDQEDVETGAILPGNWRGDGELVPLNRTNLGSSSGTAKEIRNKLKEYYIGEGRVSFQYRMCGLPEE